MDLVLCVSVIVCHDTPPPQSQPAYDACTCNLIGCSLYFPCTSPHPCAALAVLAGLGFHLDGPSILMCAYCALMALIFLVMAFGDIFL
jgi:hypothetical protein